MEADADEDEEVGVSVEAIEERDLSGGGAGGAAPSRVNHVGFGKVFGGVFIGLVAEVVGDFWLILVGLFGIRETVSLMKVGELDLMMTCPVTTSRSTADPPREESLEERRDDSASTSLTLFDCGIGPSSGKVSITSSLSRSVTRADILGRAVDKDDDLSPLTEVGAEEATGVVAVEVVVVEVMGAVEEKNLSLALIASKGGFWERLSFGCTGGDAAKNRSFALRVEAGDLGGGAAEAEGEEYRGILEVAAVGEGDTTGAAIAAFLLCSATRFSTWPATYSHLRPSEDIS